MRNAMASRLALLGNRTPRAFLAHHWHREALLVRQAMPAFAGLFSRAKLFALAGRDDVESRIVVRAASQFTVAHGPFRRADLRALPPRGWTLLVNTPTRTPVTDQVEKAARTAGVPIVEVGETLPAGTTDYVEWIKGQLDALRAALDRP